MEVDSYHVFSAIPISRQRLHIVMLSHIPSLHPYFVTHIFHSFFSFYVLYAFFMFSFVTLVSLGSYLSSLSSLFLFAYLSSSASSL